MPAIIIPFIPFGIWELRLPVAWSLNYLVERFNGIDEGSLQPGRGYGSRGYISQGKKLPESTYLVDGQVCSRFAIVDPSGPWNFKLYLSLDLCKNY